MLDYERLVRNRLALLFDNTIKNATQMDDFRIGLKYGRRRDTKATAPAKSGAFSARCRSRVKPRPELRLSQRGWNW